MPAGNFTFELFNSYDLLGLERPLSIPTIQCLWLATAEFDTFTFNLHCSQQKSRVTSALLFLSFIAQTRNFP